VGNRELINIVSYNDLQALEDALTEHPTAAVIMEIPGESPLDGYLQAALESTHRHGALFILDEIVTGFRYAIGGAQELFGFVPDLACLGKGMANGYPLAAVVGLDGPMRAFEEIFFSMTYSGETVSLAAAKATLGILRSEPVLDRIWARGRELRGGICGLADGVSFDVDMPGNPPRSALGFRDRDGVPSPLLRGLFLQECHKRGVLFGGPIFTTYSHTEQDVERTLSVVGDAFDRMELAYRHGDLEAHLEGRPPGQVFRSYD
jgi:glutamate-1-semialdehyde aminotransferase